MRNFIRKWLGIDKDVEKYKQQVAACEAEVTRIKEECEQHVKTAAVRANTLLRRLEDKAADYEVTDIHDAIFAYEKVDDAVVHCNTRDDFKHNRNVRRHRARKLRAAIRQNPDYVHGHAIIFHGGCISCTRQKTDGLIICTQCQYMCSDLDLPDLGIRPEESDDA